MLDKTSDFFVDSLIFIFFLLFILPVLSLLIQCSNNKDVVSNCTYINSYLTKTYEYQKGQGQVPNIKEFGVYKCENSYDTILIKRYR